MESITRPEARRQKLLHYFTGKPCIHGHLSHRFVSTAICAECANIKNRRRMARRRIETPAVYVAQQLRHKEQSKARALAHPVEALWRSIKRRAKRFGIPFNLTVNDLHIPATCPVLGIPLRRGIGKLCQNSPSVDRIEGAKGYVYGNVRVISFRANAIKSDASLHELLLVVAYVKRELAQCEDQQRAA